MVSETNNYQNVKLFNELQDLKPLSVLQALKALFTSRSTGIGRKGRLLTAEDLEAYLYALSQPGALTGALNYYRNVFRWGTLHSPKDVQVKDIEIVYRYLEEKFQSFS